jgi:PKHD-type hydroxylase
MDIDGWKQSALKVKSVAAVLTTAECEAIKMDALSLGMSRALVRKGRRRGYEVSEKRTSDLAKLPRSPEREWLYERMLAQSQEVNTECWRFALTGIEEMQVLRYRPLQRFKWHYDTFADGSPRKLTCVVNLCSPQSHWRGGLEVLGKRDGKAIALLQGSATWFPAYLRHRATAPWWGERWVLVTWLTGPAWV